MATAPSYANADRAVHGSVSCMPVQGYASDTKSRLMRLSLQVEPELHRRIKIAAATERVSIRDWILRLAVRELDHGRDGAITADSITPPAVAVDAPLSAVGGERPSTEEADVANEPGNLAMERFVGMQLARAVDASLQLVAVAILDGNGETVFETAVLPECPIDPAWSSVSIERDAVPLADLAELAMPHLDGCHSLVFTNAFGLQHLLAGKPRIEAGFSAEDRLRHHLKDQFSDHTAWCNTGYEQFNAVAIGRCASLASTPWYKWSPIDRAKAILAVWRHLDDEGAPLPARTRGIGSTDAAVTL